MKISDMSNGKSTYGGGMLRTSLIILGCLVIYEHAATTLYLAAQPRGNVQHLTGTDGTHYIYYEKCGESFFEEAVE